MGGPALAFIARRLKVMGACVLFGAAYGAVCGALYGTLLVPGFGTAFGAVYGLMMGCVSGIIGGVVGGPLGWCLAGMLGSVAPWLLDGSWTVLWNLFVVPPAGIGGCLGVAVGLGLRKGKSRLPGVEPLSRVIYPDGPPRRPAGTPTAPSEVAPAGAPAGRGDETAPAGPLSTG
jgi:hypothetical protein